MTPDPITKLGLEEIKAQLASARDELAEISALIDTQNASIAELRARIDAPVDDDADESARKAARAELAERRTEIHRLQEAQRDGRAKTAGLRQRAREGRAEILAAAAERFRIRATEEGVADYMATSSEDGEEEWVPGYARNPAFLTSRREFVAGCREHAGLLGTDRVLDVGCGIGGIAVFLVEFLEDGGSYVGLDVEERSIAACQRNIAARHDNFAFDVMDVWSSKYNATGRYQPNEYRFPYADGSFDFAILRSVFTHMLPPDVDHYLAELGRLLESGGRAAITFFLVNPETEEALAAGVASRAYPHVFDGYRLQMADVAEAAVAIDEQWVMDAYANHGFDVTKIDYGQWRTPGPGSTQDCVYAIRR